MVPKAGRQEDNLSLPVLQALLAHMGRQWQCKVSATVKHVIYKEHSWAVLHSVEGCSYVDSGARLM